MARLIDADALIEAIPIVTEDKKIDLYGAVADFMIMISAMPTVEVVRDMWIPVTERLPEDLPENKGKKVIPCLVAYRPNEIRKLTTQFRQRAFSEHIGWHWKKLGAYSITYWMPLPEPPKEG